MKLYIVRHGQSEANRLHAHAGWAPTPLTELGMEQARSVGARLAHIRFEKVYVSDILRARQTAQLALPGYEYLLDERIREFGVGELAGKLVADCMVLLGEAYRESAAVMDFVAYGGENTEMVQERVNRFMRDMEQEAAEGRERIAVVSHDGPICCMVRYALQCDVQKKHLLVGNASVTVLEYQEGNWRLVVSGMEDV